MAETYTYMYHAYVESKHRKEDNGNNRLEKGRKEKKRMTLDKMDASSSNGSTANGSKKLERGDRKSEEAERSNRKN